MSQGTGFLGRDIDFTFGGAVIAGVVSKSLSMNNSPIDTSSDTSNGRAEYLAVPGRKDVTVGISAKVKNLDLIMSYFNNDSQMYASVMTFPDGSTTNSTLTGDVFVTSLSLQGEHEDLTTIDMELTYSGDVVFVAAT